MGKKSHSQPAARHQEWRQSRKGQIPRTRRGALEMPTNHLSKTKVTLGHFPEKNTKHFREFVASRTVLEEILKKIL